MPAAILRNGKRFDVDAGVTILNAALGQGIALEYSCRTGRCGVCKALVTDGDTAAIRPETGLSADDLAQGKILTCCRTAVADTMLDIVDLGRLADQRARTLPARISEIRLLSPTIIRVRLRFAPGQRLDYLPGQYLDVIARGVRRSYSIANAPREDATIDLDIRRFEGGVLSTYWFDEAQVNDLVRVEGPLGTFFLRDEPPETVLFLATGTGIAPVRAMLEEIAAEPDILGGADVRIYWGNRTPEDFYWSPEHAAGAFHSIVSRPVEGWSGRRGHVQHAVLEDGVDLSSAVVYACGSQNMIGAAERLFLQNGLSAHSFHFDAFVSSSTTE
ncbi:2Fe-2S iron-sulfur cluster-binding protein [Sphingosinithalassobacter sp. LHW66-3]|uniref:2Fe-2S iron-sulfur cluster-binding protein n=1 Tax=Sphingosinithalassobacter sp. LHW66-3 TaxID=3424718 RepID=UPI003D6A805A